MKEILPGIYQMTLTLSGFNPGSINVYLIRDIESYTLVDTGWNSPPSVKSMHDQLNEFNISPADINRVIITHCHIDHLGMIGRFKKANNAKIYLHKSEIPLIKIRFRNGDQFIPMTDSFLRNHGVPERELPPPEVQIPDTHLTDPDILLEGGELIRVGEYGLSVINTPGHTPGHISLYEADKKFLISGDVLLPTIATNAALHIQHIQNPLRQYMNSLLTLRDLDIDLVLPGHEQVFSCHRKRIDELISQHERKRDEILKTFGDQRPRTAYEVSQALCASQGERTLSWTSLSGWDKRFAALQVVAYLEEMAFDNRILRFTRDSKIYFQLTACR